VPVGSMATVRLPGQPDRQVGSGTYEFRATMPPTPTTTDTAA
jgi:hypothetical protein